MRHDIMSANLHLTPDSLIAAKSWSGGHWLHLGTHNHVAVHCRTPEQAEAIAAAATDLAARLRAPDVVEVAELAPDESPAEEYARSQATGTLAH